MLSKNWSKIIQSLQNKKNRKQEGLFFVEGAKNVLEALNSDFVLEKLFVTEEFLNSSLLTKGSPLTPKGGINNSPLTPEGGIMQNTNVFKAPFGGLGATFGGLGAIVTEKELIQAGTLQSNNAALAVFKMKENVLIYPEDEFVLFLDNLQDPGNLGTIIRLCDWYNIKKIVCTPNTVDFYNPKTIAATMGSFTRVQVCYCPAQPFFDAIETISNRGNSHSGFPKIPIFGTFMEGENIHKIDFKTDFTTDNEGHLVDISSGVIVMGNEANGISDEVAQYVTRKITIPRFGNAESLNVGVATAIILDNLRR